MKKGQIVTDLSHQQLFGDAVWALYAQRQLLRHKNDNVYLHSEAPFDAFSRWYDKSWDPQQPVTYTDYTGWDTGVNESFTLFYRNVLLSYGVPLYIADKFAEDRHSRHSFMGPMPAMQASGDRYTWLMNTIGNMGLTGISFDAVDSACAFSGDDMIICGSPTFSPPDGYAFQPKLTVAPTGEFCGHMFGSHSLHESSRYILHRATLAMEDGRNDQGFWDSIDLSLRHAPNSAFFVDEYFDAAVAVSASAREVFKLGPSPRPLRPHI
jgi:hypothetical protein